MEFRESGILLAIGGAEFGSVHFGPAGSLASVTASFPDGSCWIISPALTRLAPETVEQHARKLAGEALSMAIAESADSFLPETLAYIRSLPAGRKSNYLDSKDRILADEAVVDVRLALKAAMANMDSYRAAVDFETRVPFLVADRGLIEIMDGVILEFRRTYDETAWMAVAAAKAEEVLKKDFPFLASQAESWRAST